MNTNTSEGLSAAAPVSPQTPRQKTVLIVDDEEPICRLVERILAPCGFQVMKANTGAEAVRLFRDRSEKIDLVLLDATLPDVSGELTLQQIRQLDQHCKVVLASGYQEATIRPLFSDQVLAGFVQKPFRLKELGELIQGLVENG